VNFVSHPAARVAMISTVLGVLSLVVAAPALAASTPPAPSIAQPIQLKATYTVGHAPDGIAYNPYNQEVYVANSASSSVYALNASTGAVRYTISVGSDPGPVVYDPANHDVYVADTGGSKLSIIPPNNTAPTTVNVGSHPNYLLYDSTNKDVYVSVWGPTDSQVVAVANKTLKMTVITGPNEPISLTFDTATSQVYVENNGNNTIEVVSNANKIVSWIGVYETTCYNGAPDYPSSLAYDPANKTVWSGDCSNQLDVLQGGAVITSVSLPSNPESLAYDPANGDMYVSEPGCGCVSIVNATSYQLIDSLPVGSNPTNLVYDPSNKQMYVAAYDSNWVAAILLTSVNAQVTFVPVGPNPDAMFYSAVQSTVWALDHGGNTISVVSS
jgi:YVTN family beta-propeller protein